MAYYLACDINGACTLKLNADNLAAAIDEAYERVNEAYDNACDLDDVCGIDTANMGYREAIREFELAGAKLVNEAGCEDGIDILRK